MSLRFRYAINNMTPEYLTRVRHEKHSIKLIIKHMHDMEYVKVRITIEVTLSNERII